MLISAAIARMLRFRLDRRKVVHDDAAWIRTPAKRARAAISAIISMSLVSSVGVVCSTNHATHAKRGPAGESDDRAPRGEKVITQITT
jgi:hypothetical protein